eukprot:TRINITY_DN49801_c0_g1_i1.p1 TRINITY_DN49801_c0_g1~~TRINITY_DN49801_c0_g1_i1.p1  ORF type:complete len:235 (+),score=42.75 TRINITY_DN49801_c0_g1_i1:61-705(+)
MGQGQAAGISSEEHAQRKLGLNALRSGLAKADLDRASSRIVATSPACSLPEAFDKGEMASYLAQRKAEAERTRAEAAIYRRSCAEERAMWSRSGVTQLHWRTSKPRTWSEEASMDAPETEAARCRPQGRLSRRPGPALQQPCDVTEGSAAPLRPRLPAEALTPMSRDRAELQLLPLECISPACSPSRKQCTGTGRSWLAAPGSPKKRSKALQAL